VAITLAGDTPEAVAATDLATTDRGVLPTIPPTERRVGQQKTALRGLEKRRHGELKITEKKQRRARAALRLDGKRTDARGDWTEKV